MPLPVEIVALGKPTVQIVWDEGDEQTFDARGLRLACKCAHCVNEMTGVQMLDPASVPAVVTVSAIDMVGNYGIQITFSDGHNTGIYRFRDLYGATPTAG
jgi:ATP-binding protein involved in chromosome partitioning